jgi:xanthine dehydrogenase YagS FAD-binding subunit
MRAFAYERPSSEIAAVRAASALAQLPLVQGSAPVEYLAGGTTLVDLMKLDVMRPARVVDLGAIADAHDAISVSSDGVRFGAFVKMAAAADHPEIIKNYPVIAQSLQQAASGQLRNMATLGGNVLQRTRCRYFRDTSWTACNKRDPGSGCEAIDGLNRQHALLGASPDCIATYPGDFAQSLIALDATVTVTRSSSVRTIPFAGLHRLPGATPNAETALALGDLITGFDVPAGPWTRRSLYLKIRDWQSYEFALASAAVALDMDGSKKVREARIALGGVATVPWRSHEAEEALAGKLLTEEAAEAAARAAFAAARPRTHNGFKVALGQATLARALLQAAELEG